MFEPAVDAALTVPNTAFDAVSSIASAPFSAYDFLNGLTGYDIGTASLGAGLMSIAALTDVVPVLGDLDNPVLYPLGAAFLLKASENRPIPEATKTILFDEIGGAIRRIVPGSDAIVPEKSVDPMGYAVGGAIVGAAAITTIAVALKLGDVI